ncbi:MAG: hypothetical protein ACOCUR_01720, partial [Nanoarchaeota archaeon]
MSAVNATGEASGSLFSSLPQNTLTNFLADINSQMTIILSENIAETPYTSFLISNPLVVLIVFFVVMLGISLFLNFINDAWKMPIAILIDVVGFMGIPHFGLLTIAAAAGGFLFFFIFFGEMEKLKYVFGIACIIKYI